MGKASITIAITSLFEGNGVERATSSLTKLADRAGWVEKKYSQSATSMSKGMADFAQKLDDAGARMEKYGARVAAVGDSLTAAITVPMVAVGGYAAKMAVDFDTAMANLRKTTDMSAQELEEFAQSALELSTVQPVSAETILNTEALGAQLGIARESLEGFAQVATGLDIATNMDAETAATEMARFANIVNMAEGDMERYGSTIVAIGNNMATTESEVSAMAQRFASAGHQAGLSEAEILGLSASMSALGIKAEMGGSALSQVFVKISKAVSSGGDELDAFAARSGMSADEFAKAWGEDAVGAFTALLKGIHDSSEAGEDMNTVLGELGITQIRNSDVMRRMAGSVDQVTEAVQLSTSAWEQNTALQDEVDSRNESMASRLQVLKNKVDEIAITVGRPLVDAVIDALNAMDPAIQAVSDAAHAFAEMDEEGQRNILMWAGMAAAAGPFLSVTGRVVKATGHVARGVSDAVSKFSIYKDALFTTDGAHMRVYESSKMLSASFGTVNNKAAIAAGGAKNYVSAWEAMYSSAKQVERANVGISESISAAAASSGKAQQKHLENATSLYRVREAAKSTYKENAKLVSSWTGTTKEAEKVAKGVRGLESELDSVRSSMKSTTGVVSTTGDAMKKSSRSAKELAASMGTSLATSAKAAGVAVKGFVKACAPVLALSVIVGIIGAIADEFARAEEQERKAAEASRTFGDLMAEAGSKAKSAAPSVRDAAKSMDEVKQSADDAFGSVTELGNSIVESFAEVGAQNRKLSAYVGTIEELANKSGLSASEQARLKAAIEGYNSITGEQYQILDLVNGKIADQNGTILENTNQINDNAAAWRRNAEAQAAQELLTDAYKKQVEIQNDLAEAQKRYNKEIDDYLIKNPDATRSQAEQSAGAKEAADKVNELKDALRYCNKDIDGLAAKSVLAAAALSEDFKGAVEQLPPTMQEAGIDIASKLSEGIELGTVDAEQAARYLGENVASVINALPSGMQDEGMAVASQLAAGICSGQITVEQAASFLGSGAMASISSLPISMQQKGLEAASALATEISNGQVSVSEAVTLLQQAAEGGLSTLPSGMSETAASAVQGFNSAIASGQQGTLAAATGLGSNAKAGVSDLPGSLASTGSDAGTSLAANLAAGSGKTLSSAQQLDSSARSGVAGLKSALGSEGTQASGSFASGIGSGRGKTSKAARTISNAASAMKDVGDMYTSGTHLSSNFASGISAGVNWVANAAARIAQAAKNALGFSVPKEGPWSGTERGGETSGYHLGQNWARGMERSVPLVEAASRRMAVAAGQRVPLSYGSSLHGSSTTTNNNSSNVTYVLNIDGTRQANIAPAVVEAMGVIFDEFNMTGSMGVR